MEFGRTVVVGVDPRWWSSRDDAARTALVSPVCSQKFANAACQVKAARSFVAGLLGDEHPCRDNAVLLTSELAGNVIRHAVEQDFLVSVAFATGNVLVAVEDGGSTKIPTLLKPQEDETSGRGLMLVNSLAAKWGFQRDPAGTVVWFELSVVDGEESPMTSEPPQFPRE
ncbi:MAG: putative anti-sigma regulatory factor, serine/threonine protein kinase [Sphaerisporangium sp.]|jgi:anti-sigma regulatory factor (Ser/Thr protein kinase)|nr:putative anti-sigma regulatory factor, serine/threonine protein kinase [Sphaerisporangium sp.]